MEIFKLNPITDNPCFEGFAIETGPSLLGRESIEKDLTPGYKSSKIREWKPTYLADIWKTAKVTGRVQPYNDFPCVDMIYPAFSQRACDALHDMLEPNGELLSLDSEVGDYFLYNITRIVDVLDVENSTCNFLYDPPTRAVDIEYFAFKEAKLEGLSIFRILEMPMMAMVTDAFKRRVYEAGLNGFDFQKIWPLPAGTNWRMQKSAPAKGKVDFKRHTMVVIFMLKKGKPDAAEKKIIKHAEQQLDAILALPALDSTYFGVYEGHDVVNGEYRMFICCQDVDILLQKLLPWFKALGWQGDVHAMKRFGNLHDVDAREEMVDFTQFE